jgi:hypothetical protein
MRNFTYLVEIQATFFGTVISMDLRAIVCIKLRDKWSGS